MNKNIKKEYEMVKVRGEVPREFFDWYQKEIFRDDGTDIDWMSKVDISEEEEEEWDGACPYCESDDLDWKDSHTPIGNPESYDTWECQECQKEINVLSITKQYLELEKEEEECCKK